MCFITGSSSGRLSHDKSTNVILRRIQCPSITIRPLLLQCLLSSPLSSLIRAIPLVVGVHTTTMAIPPDSAHQVSLSLMCPPSPIPSSHNKSEVYYSTKQPTSKHTVSATSKSNPKAPAPQAARNQSSAPNRSIQRFQVLELLSYGGVNRRIGVQEGLSLPFKSVRVGGRVERPVYKG